MTSSTPNDVSPETNERSGRIRAKRNVGDSLVDLETLAQNVASRANDAFTNYVSKQRFSHRHSIILNIDHWIISCSAGERCREEWHY